MGKPQDGTLPVSAPQRGPNSGRQTWRRRGGCLAVLALASTGWCIVSLPYLASSLCHPARHHGLELNDWIHRQEEISYDKILGNIGPAAGAKDGLVVASPSRGEPGQPDYFYAWTRDSALTYNTLLRRFIPDRYMSPWAHGMRTGGSDNDVDGDETPDRLLEPLFRSYIASQADLQTLRTRSGDLWSGGLNEPKFEADGGVFDGEWGRPQRDGPALRALTLIPYAHYLLDRDHSLDHDFVMHNLYDARLIRAHGRVIKNDLEEVARGWWMEGFDLWEEVNGHHLWTRLTSLRALQAGATLAARLNDPRAAEYYAKSAERIEARLANFWVYDNRHRGYWASSISGKNQLAPEVQPDFGTRDPGTQAKADWELEGPALLNGRDKRERPEAQATDGGASEGWGEVTKDLDCGFILSVLHAHSNRPANVSAEPSWTSFEPSHPGVLSTLRLLAKSFDGEYSINDKNLWREGRLLGRYTGDEYDGTGKSRANPWFICTHAFAQALYLAHASFLRAGVIRLSSHSAAFWSDIRNATISHPDTVWTRGDGQYEDALRKLWEVAEAYVRSARRYVQPSGEMSEQIDRINGTQRGARDLTWSHASFLDLARTRRRALLGKGAEGARAEWVAGRAGTVTSTGWTDWLWDLYH